MKVESYSVEGPIARPIKQNAVWAREGNRLYPLIYLQRPKWIVNDDQWKTIVKSVRLNLLKNFEVDGA